MDADRKLTLPPNASIVTRVRIGLKALEKIVGDEGNPYYGPLLNACMDSETYEGLAKLWRETAEGRELLDERPSLQGCELDLEALASLPEGTLGHEFVAYFEANGIEPFISDFPVRNDVDYLSKRYRETHDLFHVITGYGTDELGEMELQAFVLGNLGLRQTLLILAFSVPRQVQQRGVGMLPDYARRLLAAYRRGRNSRELLSVRYEDLWEQPVSVLAELMCAPAA